MSSEGKFEEHTAATAPSYAESEMTRRVIGFLDLAQTRIAVRPHGHYPEKFPCCCNRHRSGMCDNTQCCCAVAVPEPGISE